MRMTQERYDTWEYTGNLPHGRIAQITKAKAGSKNLRVRYTTESPSKGYGEDYVVAVNMYTGQYSVFGESCRPPFLFHYEVMNYE